MAEHSVRFGRSAPTVPVGDIAQALEFYCGPLLLFSFAPQNLPLHITFDNSRRRKAPCRRPSAEWRAVGIVC